MDKLKQYLLGAVALFAALFFWERGKRKSAEAVADNKEILDQVNKIDSQVSKNTGLLDSEEEKRKQIEKDKEDEKANTDANADFFNKR